MFVLACFGLCLEYRPIPIEGLWKRCLCLGLSDRQNSFFVMPQALGATAAKFSITRGPRGEPMPKSSCVLQNPSQSMDKHIGWYRMYNVYAYNYEQMKMLPYLGYRHRSVSHCLALRLLDTPFVYQGKLKINMATWSCLICSTSEGCKNLYAWGLRQLTERHARQEHRQTSESEEPTKSPQA